VLELSACIEWLFAEEPSFARRVSLAADADIHWVEFWEWRNKPLRELAEALEANGSRVSSFVSQPEGRLVDPATHEAFLAGVAESADAAQSLVCDGLIVLAGDALPGVDRRVQHEAIVDALRAAAPIAEARGVTLLLEPLNTRVDHPGSFLDSTVEGLDVVEEVAAPNIKLLYDLYHAAVTGEDEGRTVEGRAELIGHVHLADAPGRHEPGTGAIPWERRLNWLERTGYRGRVGLEYMPSNGETLHSLSWRDR
jgi:hydroxypyruvate isomerase